MLPSLLGHQLGLSRVDMEQHCRQGTSAERCSSPPWGPAMSVGLATPMGAEFVTFGGVCWCHLSHLACPRSTLWLSSRAVARAAAGAVEVNRPAHLITAVIAARCWETKRRSDRDQRRLCSMPRTARGG